MVLLNKQNIKNDWSKPTVKEVFNLMEEAAERYNLAEWINVSEIVGVSERTFRRWKAKVDSEPQAQSMIPFWGYALLYSAAKGESYIQPLEGCDWPSVPGEYFYQSKNYSCPPKEVLTLLVGKNSISKQTREPIGQAIGIAPKKLAQQINDESVSFSTWTLLLLYVGVPVDYLLKK